MINGEKFLKFTIKYALASGIYEQANEIKRDFLNFGYGKQTNGGLIKFCQSFFIPLVGLARPFFRQFDENSTFTPNLLTLFRYNAIIELIIAIISISIFVFWGSGCTIIYIMEQLILFLPAPDLPAVFSLHRRFPLYIFLLFLYLSVLISQTAVLYRETSHKTSSQTDV